MIYLLIYLVVCLVIMTTWLPGVWQLVRYTHPFVYERPFSQKVVFYATLLLMSPIIVPLQCLGEGIVWLIGKRKNNG
jgi:hypothetical protein